MPNPDPLPAPPAGRLTRWLAQAPTPVFIAYAVLAAFTTYFCMYAFRKPFAAAKFEGLHFLGTAVSLKTTLVVSQIIGYACSKYAGIKVCSEITPARRATTLVGLILAAEAALVLFGLLPNHLKLVAIFLNGFPLGMVWGLVVWYLEGRRTSDVLMAGLACSFIVSSGVTKDFGRALMAGGIADGWRAVPLVGPWIGDRLGPVSEAWMPALTGLHFLPVFLLAVWMLQQLPRANAADVLARAPRTPMTAADRRTFLRRFGGGMFLLCLAYLCLTAYRDFRDNYQVELFEELGYRYRDDQIIISRAETLVTAGVIAMMAFLNLFHDNRRALGVAFGIMVGGLVLLALGTALRRAGMLSGFWWMTLTGLGSYLAYVPFNTMLFERLMALTRAAGTAVFGIYVADAVGYTASVGTQLYKDLGQGGMSRLGFFEGFTWLTAGVAACCLAAAGIYFLRPAGDRPGTGTGNPPPP